MRMTTRFFTGRRLFVSVVALVLGAAGGVGAQGGNASVAGTWTMTVKGQGAHGDMTAGLSLKQDGKTVTGKMTAHGGEHAVSGEFDGSTLTLTMASDSQDQETTLTAKLKEDGTLAGYVSGPMGDLQWTAVRAASK